MDSMRAFRSLMGYHFFVDGFVKNVWTRPFAWKDGVTVTYMKGYVDHSITCYPSLVYISLNCDTGDVYSAKCNCVVGLGVA